MATPLSLSAVDMLERVGIDAYKIASGDLTWPGLITRCAATGRPLVISTGMADLHEVDRALTWAQTVVPPASPCCTRSPPTRRRPAART